MKFIALLLFLAFGFAPLSANSQLITTASSPTSLIQNVLLGPGVTVSNIMYTGSASAIGKFVATNTNLGIDSGIVITTGVISGTGGPQGPNNSSNAGVGLNGSGTPLFANLISGTTYDAAVLEFDFIPSADTVRFKYVFGSEEYPEYAPPFNAAYNDIFGFFISGPGISGQQNIAKLSNGALVSINNINNITNSSFFTSNGDGTTAPQNSSSYYIQYDGFTKVLEAISKVQCGQTYHLIFAIADVGDPIFDSGIFLQASSLKSVPPLTASYTLSNQLFPANPAMMGEGCTSATVTLTRSSVASSSALTVPIVLSGTATQGLDYSSIPTSVTFPAGQTSVQFTVNALADLLVEGQETLTIQFNSIDACNKPKSIYVNLFIGDRPPLTVDIQGDTVLCTEPSTTLTATVTGGIAPFSYSWNTGATTPSITVSPTTNQVFHVSVTDNCMSQGVSDTVTVIAGNTNPINLTVPSDTLVDCPFSPYTLQAIVSGGVLPYSFTWSSPQNATLGTTSSVPVTPAFTTTYTVFVSDVCNNTATDSISYTVVNAPIALTVLPGAKVCPADSAQLSVSATGGIGAFNYVWTPTGATTPTLWVNPLQTTTYTVAVSDDCAAVYSATDSVTITVMKPTADFIVSSAIVVDGIPVSFQNTSINAVSYQWYFGDGNSSTATNPSNMFEQPITYDVMLIAQDASGCIDTIVKPIGISEKDYFVYIPNSFTPDGSRLNNTFSVSTTGVKSLVITIYNRWGEVIYTSSDLGFKWDGTYKGGLVQQGTYNWKVTYITNTLETHHIEGHINLIK